MCISTASSVRKQLELFPDDFMRKPSKPESSKTFFFSFFSACALAPEFGLKQIVIIGAMLAFMCN